MLKYVYMTCALGASIIFLWLSLTGPPPPLTHHTYLPEVEAKPRFLLGNVSYRHFDDEAELLWRDLVPTNNGAVLATNITTGFHFWAIPAMFHQLRCLREIRHEFIALSRSGAEARRFMSDRGPGSSYANVSYCFDYVRQVRLKRTPRRNDKFAKTHCPEHSLSRGYDSASRRATYARAEDH
jgi:hypothetical protein